MAVVPSWVEAHCVVPAGFRVGRPFRLYDYQLLYLGNFYLIRGEAEWIPDNPVFAPAFVYRRGMIVGPQKLGKDPLIAAQICVEGVGPALFAGWAGRDDGYVCRDHGCRCGWEYAYDPGEPMGMAWTTPYIQITGVSEDSTGNTYDALRPMIDLGPLHDLVPKTGEDFIRLPGGGRIETVTSSAPSRLGQPITHAAQGEVGLYFPTTGMVKVADTQYRNLAGMSGRASLNTNAWDPAQHSVGQREFESGATDVYRQFVRPPANLSYANRRERHKIHQAVYPPDTRRENGGHLELAAIEGEAADMVGKGEQAQAERFFGNRLVSGAGRAFDIEIWNGLLVKRPKVVPEGALITIGGDGSTRWDHFSLIGTEVASGYQWPLGIWVPAGEHVPMDQVDATLIWAYEHFDVWRGYFDPAYIESWIARWAGLFGADRALEWDTRRPKAMAYALRAWGEAQRTSELSHCAESDKFCTLFSTHVGNAVRRETGFQDDGGFLWTVEKDRPGSHNKIDSVPAAALSWEARNDAIAAGALMTPAPSVYETRGFRILRRESLQCPDCHRETVAERPRTEPPGWRCRHLEGGCGQIFDPGDERITSQLAEAR